MSELAKKNCFKEAVCIEALRVFDSCSAQDCLEDLQVMFSPGDQALVPAPPAPFHRKYGRHREKNPSRSPLPLWILWLHHTTPGGSVQKKGGILRNS